MNIQELFVAEGYKIVTNHYIGDETKVQVRSHRKKRINKKYLKRYGLKTIFKANGKIYIMDNYIIIHPDDYKHIKNLLEKEVPHEATQKTYTFPERNFEKNRLGLEWLYVAFWRQNYIYCHS